MRIAPYTALAGLLCSLLGMLTASAQDARLMSLLDSKNKQIDDAIIKGDLTPVLGIFSPGVTITNPVGAFIGLENLASSLRSGTLKYTSIEVSEEKLARYGDVAVLTFLSNDTGTMQGHDISGKVRYTGVWARQSSQWKLVAVQLTPVIYQPQ